MKSLIYKSIIFAWSLNPVKSFSSKIIKKLKLPIGKLKRDLWFDGNFNLKYFNKSFKLIADKEDKSSLSIFWDGLDNSWDAQSIKIWGTLAKNSETIFDIGSNIGLYAIAAKTINPKSQVFAFEPSKRIITRLIENIKLNSLEINVIPAALSNFNGIIDFFDLSTLTAAASLKFNENLKGNEHLISYEVKVQTFLDFVKNNKIKKIDLISIDVEMNEPEVLEGMGELINKFRPNFIIEVLNNEIGIEIQNYFNNLNYVFFEIDEKNGLNLRDNIKRSSKFIDHNFNFLICRHETAIDLKLIQS